MTASATVPRLADLPGRPCPIAGALEVVGDRWALLVVREVWMGAHRFTDIARGTGAPRDRLTARLNDLVAVGVLERRQYSDAPPRSDYHLTESGRDLVPVLQALLLWGDRHVAGKQRRHDGHDLDAELVCRTCDEPMGGTPPRNGPHPA